MKNIRAPNKKSKEAIRLFLLQKNRNEVKHVGRIFHADIFDCPSSCAWIYCLAVKTPEERQGRKQQGDDAASPRAAYRVPRQIHGTWGDSKLCL